MKASIWSSWHLVTICGACNLSHVLYREGKKKMWGIRAPKKRLWFQSWIYRDDVDWTKEKESFLHKELLFGCWSMLIKIIYLQYWFTFTVLGILCVFLTFFPFGKNHNHNKNDLYTLVDMQWNWNYDQEKHIAHTICLF